MRLYCFDIALEGENLELEQADELNKAPEHLLSGRIERGHVHLRLTWFVSRSCHGLRYLTTELVQACSEFPVSTGHVSEVNKGVARSEFHFASMWSHEDLPNQNVFLRQFCHFVFISPFQYWLHIKIQNASDEERWTDLCNLSCTCEMLSRRSSTSFACVSCANKVDSCIF